MHDQEATSYRAESIANWRAAAPAWERERAAVWSASRRIGEWMVERVDPQPGERVLEVACGAGDTGLLAAARVGVTGRLLSTDQAPEMVEAACRRAAELGLANVECRTLDAEAMDLEDGTFDVALCRWGYMLMADPLTALRETRRVLRPGGRLAMAVWSDPARNPWANVIAGAFLDRGLVQAGDPDKPGMFRLGDPAALKALLLEAGFGSVELEELPVVWAFPSFDEAWRVQTALSPSLGPILHRLEPGEADEIRADAERRSQPYRSGDAIELPGLSLGAYAR